MTWGKILKQRRLSLHLNTVDLGRAVGVSSSHLGRIERGERFPSARILPRMTKPLGFGELEILTLAGYLTPQTSSMAENSGHGQLDPYVAGLLAQEPVKIQRAVGIFLMVLKGMAKGDASLL